MRFMGRNSISPEGDQTIFVGVKIPLSWKKELEKGGNISYEIRKALEEYLGSEGETSQKGYTHIKSKPQKNEDELWEEYRLNDYPNHVATKLHDIMCNLKSDGTIKNSDVKKAIGASAGCDSRTIKKYAELLVGVGYLNVPYGISDELAIQQLVASDIRNILPVMK